MKSVRFNKSDREFIKRAAASEAKDANPTVETDCMTARDLVREIVNNSPEQSEIDSYRRRIEAMKEEIFEKEDEEYVDEVDGVTRTRQIFKVPMSDTTRQNLKDRLRGCLRQFEKTGSRYIRVHRPEALHTRERNEGESDWDYRRTLIWDEIAIQTSGIERYNGDLPLYLKDYADDPNAQKLLAFLDRAATHNRKAKKARNDAAIAADRLLDACTTTKQLLELMPTASRWFSEDLKDRMYATSSRPKAERATLTADEIKTLNQTAAKARLNNAADRNTISGEESCDAESSA